MDKRINSNITKKIKNKFGFKLSEYAENRGISLASLKAFISGKRQNMKVISTLITDEIINFTEINKNKNKGIQL